MCFGLNRAPKAHIWVDVQLRSVHWSSETAHRELGARSPREPLAAHRLVEARQPWDVKKFLRGTSQSGLGSFFQASWTLWCCRSPELQAHAVGSSQLSVSDFLE